MGDYGRIGDGLVNLIKVLTYFCGAAVGGVVALIIAAWIPVGWWCGGVVLGFAVGARAAFYALVRE